jgi:hypothetical protein
MHLRKLGQVVKLVKGLGLVAVGVKVVAEAIKALKR